MANAAQSPPAGVPTVRLGFAAFGLGALVSLLMVFVGWRAQGFVANSPDPYGYVAMGRSLLHGEGFAAYGSVLNRRGPLYPALIAVVFALTGESPLALRIVQALMMGGVCALVFDIGVRLYNVRTGLIAAILCSFHPALLRYVADFHVETLLTFLSTLTIWRGVLLLQDPGPKNGALFGASAALAALAKPTFLLFPGAFVAWWIVRERGSSGLRRATRPQAPLAPWLRTRWPAVAAVFLAMGVLILPWTYRNYRSSGHPVLITTGVGDAFLRGYIFSQPDYALLRRPPYTDAENESNALFRSICEREGTVWQRNDVESDRILSRASRAKFFSDPADFVRKVVVQLFTFWYEMTSLANSLVTGLLAVVLWIPALIGWRRARAEGALAWPLLLPILCLNLSLAILLALGRYSVPIVPALAVLAAFGIDTLMRKRDVEVSTPVS